MCPNHALVHADSGLPPQEPRPASRELDWTRTSTRSRPRRAQTSNSIRSGRSMPTRTTRPTLSPKTSAGLSTAHGHDPRDAVHFRSTEKTHAKAMLGMTSTQPGLRSGRRSAAAPLQPASIWASGKARAVGILFLLPMPVALDDDGGEAFMKATTAPSRMRRREALRPLPRHPCAQPF